MIALPSTARTMVIIWMAIFSPAIAAVAGVAYLANRAKGRFLPSRARSPKKGPEPKVDDGASDGPEGVWGLSLEATGPDALPASDTNSVC